MNTDGLTIAFAGGGTGGHIQPIVSLIEYAQNHSEIIAKCKNLYRFGEAKSQESSACSRLEDVLFVPIASGKLRRYRTVRSTLENIRDSFLFVFGFFQSLRLLRKYSIDVVFCKGGYVALPVCFAAWILRRKILMHESDMKVGLTNRLVARIASIKFVGFPQTFTDEIHTGQILSDRLATYTTKQEDRTQVLVMGGSQGAAVVFDTLLALLSQGKLEDIDFHILCGTKNTQYQEQFNTFSQVTIYGFVNQETIAGLYARCDVAVTRGSVTSLAEQQLFGIKKIIVPLPRTGGNHQFYNALWYSDTYEDIFIEQNDHLMTQLSVFLEKMKSYKKDWKGINKEELSSAKQIIRDTIHI